MGLQPEASPSINQLWATPPFCEPQVLLSDCLQVPASRSSPWEDLPGPWIWPREEWRLAEIGQLSEAEPSPEPQFPASWGPKHCRFHPGRAPVDCNSTRGCKPSTCSTWELVLQESQMCHEKPKILTWRRVFPGEALCGKSSWLVRIQRTKSP